MKNILIVCFLCYLTVSLPTTFDIRVQPSVAAYGDFTAGYEPVCQAYVWARQLAQIISNAFSIRQKQKIKLSGQQIVECVSSETDMCQMATLQNIESAIKYVTTKGITEQECYTNKFMQLPGEFCKNRCDNKQEFVRKIRASIYEQSSIEQLLRKIGSGKFTGFAIVKLYSEMNYYSSQFPQFKAQGDLYGYTIGQIVGWKNSGKTIIIRLGSSGWGYKGYANIDITSSAIVKKYSVDQVI